MSADRTDAVLASIDGALADAELPDAMRWSPEPEAVADASDLPYDGEVVPLPPQRYEPAARQPDPWGWPAGSWRLRALDRPGAPAPAVSEALGELLDSPEYAAFEALPEPPTVRGGIRYPWPPRDEGSDALGLQHARCRAPVQPVFSDHRPPLAMDLNLPVHAELAAAGRPLRMREALLLRLLTHPEQTTEAINQAFQAVIDALRPAVEQFGRGLAEVARQFQGAIPGGPQPTPEPEDVRARALRLRQQRNTGPDRQIQHRPRPRRHQA